MRKVANTLRTSVYAQYCWAVDAMGLTRYFTKTKTPMEIVYRPTGQKILFFGMDDPGKLKSIKVPFGYPRVPEEIAGTQEYFSLVSRLAERFCDAGRAEEARQ